MNPFLFMPEVPSSQNLIHLERYKKFIWTRLFRKLPEGEYTERHHIVPKSFGMNEDFSQAWNIINLTAREHYLAHLMLWKAFGSSMAQAFWMMCNYSKYKAVSSLLYQRAKESFIPYKRTESIRKKQSIALTGIKRSASCKQKNSNARKNEIWITNGNVDRKIPKTTKIPEGFYRGISQRKVSQESKDSMVSFLKNLCWVTNGSENKHILKTEEVPEGWRKGRSNLPTGFKWISDGISLNKKILREEKIPLGWKEGRVMKPYKKRSLKSDF